MMTVHPKRTVIMLERKKLIIRPMPGAIQRYGYAAYAKFCKVDLFKRINNLDKILETYCAKSGSTGTKYPTLRLAVKQIQANKPQFILECGTGVSTIVIAECLHQLKQKDPTYSPILISMESIEEWHRQAQGILPEKYKEFTTIILGERKLFQLHMFRGYRHSNIPKHDYDFVFLDGPNYKDQRGLACCMDSIFVREEVSKSKILRGVIDTRVSSVYVHQQLYGTNSIKYSPLKRTSSFKLEKLPTPLTPKAPSEMFEYSLTGEVSASLPSLDSLHKITM